MDASAGQEIFEAIKAGDAARVREIVRRDVAAASARDADGISAVLQARYRDREDIVAALVAVQPTLDVFDAAAIGDSDRTRTLIEADPGLVHAWSGDGFTPLHLAVFFGQAETARLLIDRGAAVDAPSRNRMEVMPLHSAVAGRHREVVEALLDAGAPVNAKTHGGFTPLTEAAENGDLAIAELLLDRGGDPEAITDTGKTARDLALERGHGEVADRLAERG